MSLDLGPFGGPLMLTRARVEHNVLAPAATARGGGLFVEDQPLAVHATRIRHNEPDQCVGCGTAGDERSLRRPPGGHRAHGDSPLAYSATRGGVSIAPRLAIP